MKNKIEKSVIKVVLSLLVLSNVVFAKQVIGADIITLIDTAGKQRMLSQRIAKSYLYLGKNVASSKANKELKRSMEEFFKGHKLLVKSINDPEIKNLLEFVALSSDEIKETTEKKYNLDRVQLVLDLSESLLEGSQYIVDSLKKRYAVKESDIVEKSGSERMLAQRIAKYYIAYQSGVKDDNTVSSMKLAVNQFSKNLKFLMSNKNNTPIINQKLNEIDRLWKIVHKFYNNIEKGGLPLIVFNTTNQVTKKMDKITKLYILMHKK